MAFSFTRLDELRIHSMNLKAECSNCGHHGVVDGPKLWRWFALHRWNDGHSKVAEHLRCSVCKRRPTNLAPTQEEPTMDFGPRSEAEWKTTVKRLRG